jgi:hypothetical protein
VGRSDIVIHAILRCWSGAIVGAGTAGLWRLPDPVPPGTKLRALVRVSGVMDEPTTAEVFAYARPTAARR